MYSATLNDRAMRYMVARNGWSMSAALNGHYACCRLFNNMSGYHQMPLALCATGLIFIIEKAERIQHCSAACSVFCGIRMVIQRIVRVLSGHSAHCFAPAPLGTGAKGDLQRAHAMERFALVFSRA